MQSDAWRSHLRGMVLIALSLGLVGCQGGFFRIFQPQTLSSSGNPIANTASRAKAQAELAAGYVDLGRFDIAKSEVNKALAIDEYSPEANNVAGLIAMEIGKMNEAEFYLLRALNIDPENSHYQNNVALYYCKTGSASRGMELLKRALDNKLYNSPQNSLMNAGLCSETTGNLSEAERYYNQAMRYDGVHLLAKEKMAGIYLRTNRANQAWLTINEVIASLDNATITQLRLGVAAARALGRHDEADNLQRRIQRDYPDKASDATISNNPAPQGQTYGNMPYPVPPSGGAYGYVTPNSATTGYTNPTSPYPAGQPTNPQLYSPYSQYPQDPQNQAYPAYQQYPQYQQQPYSSSGSPPQNPNYPPSAVYPSQYGYPGY